MRLLIAIVSCARDKYTHDAVRQTWAPWCSPQDIDYKFFTGGMTTEPDEIHLDCDDSYEGVTDKALKTFQWALDKKYDYMLHVGRDTYVCVPNLVPFLPELEQYPYAGHCGYADWTQPSREADRLGRYAYASGGAGSWLSAYAMKLIIDSPIRHVADDLMFGWALGCEGIVCRHDLRFKKRGDVADHGAFTVHLSYGTGNYQPQWMIDCHNRTKQLIGRR